MKGNFIIPLFALLLLGACKKEISNPISVQPPTSLGEVFDAFWNQMNMNYVYWDIDTTHWDAIYSRYKPLFGQLRLGEPADMAQSVAYFREMTSGLTDHHFSISFTNPMLKDSLLIPASDQLKKDPGFHFPYPYLLRDMNYLDSGYLFGTDNVTDPDHPLLALTGTIHGNVLFFTCNQFALTAAAQSPVANGAQPVLAYFMQHLQNTSGLKAVVLDLRDNPGGSVSDLHFLAGPLIDHPLIFGSTRYKDGNGRLDYTPWIDATVTAQPGARAFPLLLFILADRYSASMAEILTMALRVLPQCRVVGETTYGATGPFAANALYNDGPFEVPGFLSVVESSTEFRYIDGKMYEGKGFPPDYPVPFDQAALNAGGDPQMDKALSLIK